MTVTIYDEFMADIRRTEGYRRRELYLRNLLRVVSHTRDSMDRAAFESIRPFAFGELAKVSLDLEAAAAYREKDQMYRYETAVLQLIPLLYPSVGAIPAEGREQVRAAVEQMEKARYFESAIDELFSRPVVDEDGVSALLHMAAGISDEYQKGLLYPALLHYQEKLVGMTDTARRMVGDYLTAEMERYVSLVAAEPADPSPDPEEDIGNALEVACDLSRYFMNDRIRAILRNLLTSGRSKTVYFCMSTLLAVGEPIPAACIEEAARDGTRARGLYDLFRRYGRENEIPADCRTPDYLAGSSLTVWLSQMQIFGQVPDAVEFLGTVTMKGHTDYVFRFSSDNELLTEAFRGRWLVGWVNEEGDVFSHFDDYTPCEKRTRAATLRCIRRRLIA